MAPLTGRKVLWITLLFFGIVIAVNLIMATLAIDTFPGLEVRNSYVASQTFDEDRSAQDALGWSVTVDATAGTLRLSIADRDGTRVVPPRIAASIGRATEIRDDRSVMLMEAGGRFSAPLDLPAGRWILRIEATAADGTAFRQRLTLNVGDNG